MFIYLNAQWYFCFMAMQVFNKKILMEDCMFFLRVNIIQKLLMICLLFFLCNSYALAQTNGVISGRVYHDESPYNPIPGVFVICYDFDSEIYVSMGITQDDGTYSIETSPGDYKIFVNTDIEDQPKLFIPEYYPDSFDSYFAQKVSVLSGQLITNINFALSIGGVILGYVFDQNNNPIQYARVEAYNIFGDLMGYTKSLENGRYFLHVPKGSYKIRSYTQKNEYVTAFYPNTFSFHDAEQIEVQLEIGLIDYNFYLIEGVTVQGTVTNDSNIPISNVYVWALGTQQEQHWALTSQNGEYSMVIPPGQYNFLADERSFGFLKQYYLNAYDIKNALLLDISNEATTPPIDFQMVFPGFITGSVIENWNSSPVNNIQLMAIEKETQQIVTSVRTGSDGTYAFALPEGQYFLVIDDIQSNYLYQFFNQTTQTSKAQILTVKQLKTILSVDFNLIHLPDIILMLQCLSANSITGLNIKPLDINGNNQIDMPDVLYLLTLISQE